LTFSEERRVVQRASSEEEGLGVDKESGKGGRTTDCHRCLARWVCLARTAWAQGGQDIRRGARTYDCDGNPLRYGAGDRDATVGHGLVSDRSAAGEQSRLEQLF
jgi:hypothetical protein